MEYTVVVVTSMGITETKVVARAAAMLGGHSRVINNADALYYSRIYRTYVGTITTEESKKVEQSIDA